MWRQPRKTRRSARPCGIHLANIRDECDSHGCTHQISPLFSRRRQLVGAPAIVCPTGGFVATHSSPPRHISLPVVRVSVREYNQCRVPRGGIGKCFAPSHESLLRKRRTTVTAKSRHAHGRAVASNAFVAPSRHVCSECQHIRAGVMFDSSTMEAVWIYLEVARVFKCTMRGAAAPAWNNAPAT